jgi:hypothetical protein
MEATRRLIQTVRFILVGAVVMYAFVVWRLHSSATPDPIMLRVIAGVCVSEVVIVFVMRRLRLSPPRGHTREPARGSKGFGSFAAGLRRYLRYQLVNRTLWAGVALSGILYVRSRAILLRWSGADLVLSYEGASE